MQRLELEAELEAKVSESCVYASLQTWVDSASVHVALQPVIPSPDATSLFYSVKEKPARQHRGQYTFWGEEQSQLCQPV